MDRVERAQARLGEPARGEQDGSVDREQRHRLEHFRRLFEERSSGRPGSSPAARRIARGTSVSTSSQDTRSLSARNVRSAGVSGSARTSFTNAEASA